MPQLPMFDDLVPVRFTAEYHFDPLHPQKDPLLSLDVRDFRGRIIASWVGHVIPTLIHEQVASMMRAAWESYLFGEPSGFNRTCRAHAKEWSEIHKSLVHQDPVQNS